MSQYPYPQDPGRAANYNPYGALPYATPGAMRAPDKPTSVTVLAIFAIILGGLGTLCTGFGILVGLLQLGGGTLFNGPAGNVRMSPSIQLFSVVASVIELVLSVVLLAAGIGALTLKPWARKAVVPGWSVAMIIWAFIRLVAQLAWVTPAAMEMMNQIQQKQAARGGPPPLQMQGVMSGMMIVVAVIWFLVELVMPVCFLTLWRRPHVVAAFEGGAAPAP